LAFPATITESVAATVKDLAGNPVGPTPSWSWTAPLWVKLPALPGYAPSMALDPHGNAFVSYTGGALPTTLSVVRYAPGATWDLSLASPPIVNGLSVSGASIAVGADGAPTVAWSQDHIYAAHWNGLSWDRFANYADSGTPTASTAIVSSIALAPTGLPLVAWGESASTSSEGYVASWTGATSTWQVLPGFSGGPILFVTSMGAPLALFPNAFGVPDQQLAIYEAGSWLQVGLPATLARDGSGAFHALTLDPADEPIVPVETLDSDTETIHVKVLRSNVWADLVPSFSTGLDQNAITDARVALGPDGNPFILWSSPDATSSQSLYVARYTGTTWDRTYGILNGVSAASSDIRYPTIAIDKSGTATVTWTEPDLTTGSESIYLWKSNY
jgi:hypothetical protein